MKVYLSGPITGESLENAQGGWRRRASDHLKRYGIQAFSPMRGLRAADYGAEVDKISAQGNPASLLRTQRGLTTRDRYDCTTCDVMLLHLLGSTIVSQGSMIEVGWASAHNIPIIRVMEPGNIHDHAMGNELAAWTVPDLDSGLFLVKAVLLPEL